MSDSGAAYQPTFQVAASFVFPFEADVVRLRLDWEGIPSRLTNAAFAGWFWQYSNASGGVKLLVAVEDLPRALETLDEMQAAVEFAGPETEKISDTDDEAVADEGASVETSRPLSLRPTPRHWKCSRCGACVPEEFFTCWSCGTTVEGEVDPDFERADAPIWPYDPNRPPSFWWVLVCVFLALSPSLWGPAVFLTCALWGFAFVFPWLPDRAEVRSRSRTYGLLCPALTRACMLSLFGGSWCSLSTVFSLYLLGASWGDRAVQWPRASFLFVAALTLDLFFCGVWTLIVLIILSR